MEIMSSTVQVAAAGIRSFALEAFLLGLLIAWLSLRGLSATDIEHELDHGNPDELG